MDCRDPTNVDHELVALANRRRKHDAEATALDRDLAAATERARTARLSMRKIADLAGVDRTTLYDSIKRAKAQTAKLKRDPQHPHASQN
jgi:hypothetical protein